MPLIIEAPKPVGPDRLRLPLAFDPERLSADLDALEESDWVEHPARQNYEGAWSAVPLRAPAGETHPIRLIFADPTAAAFVDTPWLDRLPYIKQVVRAFRCPLKTARLMRLAPGSRIKEHCDPGLDAKTGEARLHVPLRTSAEAEFRVNGTRVEMKAGSVWYLRLVDPHSAFNGGREPRINLVIDAVVNPWLERMLSEASAG
ncbi:MAG TPA: aspartyl/asparaginyl beta-hydroxylase domain-containing protein [Allosphingosinicella sp.]|jgi:hypothetical protein